jgi:hypothetical protein
MTDRDKQREKDCYRGTAAEPTKRQREKVHETDIDAERLT